MSSSVNTSEIINQDMDDIIEEVCGDKVVCPPNNHNAVCAAFFNAGLQPGINGWPARKKIVLVFETEETIDSGPLQGQPYRVSKIMTASLNEKSTLRQTLISWLGHDPIQKVNGKRRFRCRDLVGKPCTITVVHEEKDGEMRPRIVAVSPRMSSFPALTPKMNPSEIPEWIRKMQEQRLDKPTGDKPVAPASTEEKDAGSNQPSKPTSNEKDKGEADTEVELF